MYVAGAPKKRRVENILENYINDINFERENIKEQREEEREKQNTKKKRNNVKECIMTIWKYKNHYLPSCRH